MKKKLMGLMIYVIFASFVSIPTTLIAEPEDAPVTGKIEEDRQEELPVSDITKELGLTAEQQEQFKEQKYQSKYKRIETSSKIRLKELELRHELEKKQIDKAIITKIAGELKQLQANALDQRIDSILKIREILTPEQFEKFQQQIDKKRGHGKYMHGKGMGGKRNMSCDINE